MLHFHTDHKSLVLTAFGVFVLLSLGVAIIPAYQMQAVEALPQQEALTLEERKGLRIYISEGCVACHTQQVRGIEMDNIWGGRPSMPSDYYYSKMRLDTWRQSPSLLGSERTGPDLTDVGNRQSSEEWHLLHLYNPRAVVPASIMPSYPWLFEEKAVQETSKDDKVVAVPSPYVEKAHTNIVATEDALQLVAYLQSLKQVLVGPKREIQFIPAIQAEPMEELSGGLGLDKPDGAALFVNTCAACHQQNGKGIPGAFPSLVGSSIVNDPDPEMLISIILQGYDARPEFGMMPGFAQQLSDEEVAAIASHERKSWGNSAPAVQVETVSALRESLLHIQ